MPPSKRRHQLVAAFTAIITLVIAIFSLLLALSGLGVYGKISLEQALSVLTAVLVILTFALVWLGIRAENHLNRLNNVLLRLLRVQYVHTGTVAGRTIEVQLIRLTMGSQAVIRKLERISADAHVEAGVKNGKLVVTYRFMWEDAVFDVLMKCVDRPRSLPPKIYSRLLH